MSDKKAPTVLMVLDGWGVSTGKGRDAIAGAKTPVMDDLMARAATWADSADLAKRLEGAGFSGMLVTEASQVPWMMIAAASMASLVSGVWVFT